MCTPGGSAPKPTAPPPPPPIAKFPAADAAGLLKKRNNLAVSGPDKVASGSLLTGAAGVPASSLSLGGNSLLGGGNK